MTKRTASVVAALVVGVTACGSGSGGGGDPPDASPGPLVAEVSGTVGAVPPVDLPGSLLVGLMNNGVDSDNRCGDLRFEVEYAVESLDDFPYAYTTQRAPAGTYTLIAVLVSDPSAGFAQAGWVEVVITTDGLIELDGVERSTIDLALSGGISYACP